MEKSHTGLRPLKRKLSIRRSPWYLKESNITKFLENKLGYMEPCKTMQCVLKGNKKGTISREIREDEIDSECNG